MSQCLPVKSRTPPNIHEVNPTGNLVLIPSPADDDDDEDFGDGPDDDDGDKGDAADEGAEEEEEPVLPTDADGNVSTEVTLLLLLPLLDDVIGLMLLITS